MEDARLGTLDDQRAVEAILREASDEASTKRGGPALLATELADEAELTLALLDPAAVPTLSGEVVVGTFEGVVFGVTTIRYVADSNGSLQARVRSFVVNASARGVGIGEAMMNLVLERAAERGCSGVDGFALPGDANTKNFFESFGMKARLLAVNREL